MLKFSEQGSTVLACEAIRRAIQAVERENVYFSTLAENRFILDVMDLIPTANVLEIDSRGVFRLFFSAWRALREIRRLKIDVVVDFEFFSRASAAFAFLTGAARRVGLHADYGEGPYRGDLMTHPILYNPYLHTSQLFIALVNGRNADPDRLPAYDQRPPPLSADLPVFTPTQSDIERVRAMLPGNKPLILLNPNASDLLPLRRWPLERYAQLATRILQADAHAAVVITGASAESVKAKTLVAAVGSPRCTSIAGQTTMRDLLTVYTMADALITNDSGPAHFAALTSLRTVTLFGPETPTLFTPLNPRNVVIWRGIACSPCVNAYNGRQSACRDNVCMKGITVDDVFEALTKPL